MLIGRERQMSALIDAALSNARLRSHIDRGRIAAAGFSAGGYDALLLAGATPDFKLLRTYCRTNPDDREFCSGWHVEITRPDLHVAADLRIKAVLALAPLGIYFDRRGLAGVRVPVDIWAAGADRVLPVKWNAARIRALLRRTPEYSIVPNAGHLVFLSPCTPAFKGKAPALCSDPPGVDRKAVHSRIVADATQFFSRVFDG